MTYQRALCVLFIGVMLVLGSAARAAEETSKENADAIAQPRAAIEELMEQGGIPGFSAAVLMGGEIVWSEGFGFAHLEQGTRVDTQTRFRIGSVSKVVTAAAVGKLWQEGKLDLDAPVRQYVRAFPEKQWEFTTRQLTGHLAGIRHYSIREGLFENTERFPSVTSALKVFKSDPLIHEPGTKYVYSSYGFNLVSVVVEKAAGEPFLDYMDRQIFVPLRMTRTVADRTERIIEGRTGFYFRNRKGEIRNTNFADNSYKWAGGGFLSNTEDLARFGAMHFEPGFLEAETLELLFTSQQLTDGAETGVGIAWRIGRDDAGRLIYHHGGSSNGGRAFLLLYPEEQVVVALAANLSRANYGLSFAQKIAGYFLTPGPSDSGASPSE